METMKEKKLYWRSSLFKNKNYMAVLMVFACFLCFLFGFIFRQNQGSAKDVYYKTVENIAELKASDPSRGDNYGTAVFLNDSGLLVTNVHVVMYQKDGQMKEYRKLQIRLPVEESYRDVSLLRYNEELDIAILKLDNNQRKIKGLKIGNPKKLEYGDKVFSVGNMMNYGISIAEGIVSSPRIEIEYEGMVREVIQADINIAPGSSGGALLDKNGELIGITSFRLKDKAGDIVYGTGFAVPIDKVMEYVTSKTNIK